MLKEASVAKVVKLVLNVPLVKNLILLKEAKLHAKIAQLDHILEPESTVSFVLEELMVL